ncbi:hypothetical protein [Azoarcus sp. DN11]|uniref:PP2C family serine/threonine-protein phosphatase n=1 Tax=Azoarcus sp. DN11 TaxID=356837 RepID=UPI000FE1D9D1|nr:hypothetical protein [Azoarcus sp. DN11]
MNIETRIEWQWTSRRGAERGENRDACGLFGGKAYTFAAIIDASSKGKNGVRFNELWINALLNGLPADRASREQVITAMRNAQGKLRSEGLFQERACFAALLLPHALPNTGLAFTCGDCRIGFESQSGEIIWLTETHRLGDICQRNGLVLDIPNPNIVTRTLNARRHEDPEILELMAPEGSAWVLATDGFWSDCKCPRTPPEDDSSYLLLGSMLKRYENSDTPNLILEGSFAGTISDNLNFSADQCALLVRS